MHRALPTVIAATFAMLAADGALASSRVALAFSEATYAAEYSQGLNLELTLTDGGGAPVAGRVSVELQRDDGGAVILVTEPDVLVDAAGRARVRLTLVDGRHGDSTFSSAPDGFPYTLRARFRGAGVPLPDVTDPDCQPDAVGVDDGRLCPQTATAPLVVRPDVPALAFAEDIVMDIGDTVTLAATLTDETGDAAAAGEAIDGTAPKLLEGLPVRFFYDVDADGRPSADERLGEALTNAFGVAAFDFVADPAFVVAGVLESGLHAEFPGDRRYAIARTSVRVTINATAPDPAQTIIEATPDTLTANGVDESIIRVRLVDENGNILGPDADEVDVDVTASLGRLIDGVERDPLDGSYEVVLRAGREGGTAKITVTVDGAPAGETNVTIVGPEGCTCTSLSGTPLLVALVALLRRRRRP